MFTAFGKTFFDVTILRNDCLYVWIYVLDLPNEAKHFSYNACMVNPLEKNFIRLHEKDPYRQARSMVESHDEVIENGNCFIFDIRIANVILQGTSQLKYSLTITNTKGASKIEDLNPFITPKKSLTDNH